MVVKNPYAAYQKTTERPETAENGSATTQRSTETFTPRQNKVQRGYLENEVMTASPEKLTLMLYDGAIKFMNQSLQHLEKENHAEANDTLLRSQAIMEELMASLNMDYDVSKGLYSLYDFISGRLVDANIKKEVTPVQQAIGLTKSLRETWVEAMGL